MLFPITRLSLLSRSLIAAIPVGVGILVGWILMTGSVPNMSWLVPVIILTVAVALGAEVARTGSRRGLLALCLCGLIVGRVVYDLAVTGR